MRSRTAGKTDTFLWFTGQELLSLARHPLTVPSLFLLQLVSVLLFLLKPEHNPVEYSRGMGLLLIFLVPLFSSGIWMRVRKSQCENLLLSSGFHTTYLLSVKTAALILFWTILSFPVFIQVFLYIPLGGYSPGYFISQGFFLFQIIVVISAVGSLFSVILPSIYASYPVTALTGFFFVSVEGVITLRKDLSLFDRGYFSLTVLMAVLFIAAGLILFSSVIINRWRKYALKEFLPETLWATALILAAVLLLSLPFAADISGEKRSHLSEYSRIFLKKELEHPLYLTYYRTDDKASSFFSRDEIEQNLKKIARISPGIHLDIISSGDAEEDLRWKERGASAAPYQNRRGEDKEFFSALLLEYGGQESIIPSLLFPEDCTFHIIRTLRDFLKNQVPAVAFLNARKDLSLDNDFSLMLSTLEEYFSLQVMNSGDPVPSPCDVLVICGQQSLSSVDIYNIDRFLKSGKRVIWSVGGIYVDPRKSDYGRTYTSSPAGDYLKDQWGIELQDALVLDHRNIDIEYTGAQGSVVEPFPLWIYPSVWAYHPAAVRSSGLAYLWGSPLSIVKRENIAAVPLHYTSKEGWVFEVLFPLSPEEHLYPEKTGQYSQSLLSILSERKEGGRLLVLGSDLMFSNYIQMTGSMGNINILSDLIYQAAGPEYQDLLDIKPSVTPELSLDPQVETSLMRLFLLIQIFILPLLILITGIILQVRRARKTR